MDTRIIGSLIALMENSTLSVMDIVEGEFEIHMEKPSSSNAGGVAASYVDVEPIVPPVTMQMAAPAAPVAVPAAPAAAPAAPAPAAAAPAASAADANLTGIKSPLVGTFHPLSASTDLADIKVGDHITKGQTICILEAMKLMNEIESDFSGTVKEVCVTDGDLVEFDQPLFQIQED